MTPIWVIHHIWTMMAKILAQWIIYDQSDVVAESVECTLTIWKVGSLIPSKIKLMTFKKVILITILSQP